MSDMGHDFLGEPVESTQLAARIDGVRLEPRCRVCRNDLVRKKVNDMLVCGSSYAMILRAIGEDNAAGVTIDSIRNHAERHFPVQNVAKATYREILERRAQEAQIDFVNGLTTALTPMALYEVVMNESFRRLAAGDVDVSLDAGLRAAEKLQALTDARAGEADMADVLVRMGRVIETVREFVPPEHWPALQARLRGEDVEQPQAQPVERIRVVEIADSDDDEGNW
ncbi:MAG: hypothetical protein WAL41_01155 [Mycobacterium sp.]